MRLRHLTPLVLAGLLYILVSGCSSSSDSAPNYSTPPAEVGVSGSTGQAAYSSTSAAGENRLQALRKERSSDHFSLQLDLGPGDVIEISDPDVDELKERKVRVSSDYTVELPIAGIISVHGLTESQFREVLQKKLSKYIKDPQLEVFVREYRSRDVAVVGQVHTPGLYPVQSNADTLLDMINLAGGLGEGAGTEVIFIPSSGATGRNLAQLQLASASDDPSKIKLLTPVSETAAKPEGAESAGQPEAAQAMSASGGTGVPLGLLTHHVAKEDPIFVNVASGAGESSLDVPARPGDVLIVPASGQVMVQGWVMTPGAYRVSPGMTVLAAVTAAGGQMFTSSATLLRGTPDGRKMEMPVDLGGVSKGTSPDIPVQAGDVILVNRSAAGAVPYALYTIFNKIGSSVGVAPPI